MPLQFSAELLCDRFKPGVKTERDGSGMLETIIAPTNSIDTLIANVNKVVQRSAKCDIHTQIRGIHSVAKWGIVKEISGSKVGFDAIEFKKLNVKGKKIGQYLRDLNKVLF